MQTQWAYIPIIIRNLVPMHYNMQLCMRSMVVRVTNDATESSSVRLRALALFHAKIY